MAEDVFPSLYGTALRLTRSPEDASDLSQEALVRAYEAFDRFDGRNFKAWMLRILTNLDIEGMSYDEVAEATDVPVGTVRSRLARGRAILRRELEQFALEHGYIKDGTNE